VTELVQQQIERLRVAAGLDRHQLAAKCGVSYTAVWNWETKGTASSFRPKARSLDALAKALGTTVEYLRTGNGGDQSGGGGGARPDAQHVHAAIRELEKNPAVAAYRELQASLRGV
jgi:transcriptional regulator with XRE-family HTH domain